MRAARLASLGLRLGIGVAIWWAIYDARGIAADVCELARGRGWLLLAPLLGAAIVTRWVFGSAAWGLIAGIAAVAATVASERFQAWCLGGEVDLRGAADLGGPAGPATVLGGFTALGLCAIAAAARGRGGEAHRIASTVLLFAGAAVGAMVVALAPRGSTIDWGISLGALATYPPLVVAAIGLAAVGRVLARAPGQRAVCGWSVVNTACGYGIFIGSCALMPAFALVALGAGRHRTALVRAGMRATMRLVFIGTPTVRWSWHGDAAALARGRIVVANHDSILDILMACALPGTRNLLAKTWVFRAPFLGLAARTAGVLNVDRLDPDDFLGDGADLLGHEGLLVFPEGRRSRDGVVARFRLGAFALADRCAGEVVPVAMANGFTTATPGALWIHPGEVRSVVLPILRRDADESVRTFAERARTVVAAAAAAERRALAVVPFAASNRRGWLLGLPPAMRAAAHGEERTGLPRAFAAAAGGEGDWWLIGCGWGPAALALREVAPWSRLIAVDHDPRRLIAASFVWRRAGDEFALELGLAPTPLAGIACLLPLRDELADRARIAAAAARPSVILVPEGDAGLWAESLPGYARGAALGGLVALRPA